MRLSVKDLTFDDKIHFESETYLFFASLFFPIHLQRKGAKNHDMNDVSTTQRIKLTNL